MIPFSQSTRYRNMFYVSISPFHFIVEIIGPIEIVGTDMEIVNNINSCIKQNIPFTGDLPKDLGPGRAICLKLAILPTCRRYVNCIQYCTVYECHRDIHMESEISATYLSMLKSKTATFRSVSVFSIINTKPLWKAHGACSSVCLSVTVGIITFGLLDQNIWNLAPWRLSNAYRPTGPDHLRLLP